MNTTYVRLELRRFARDRVNLFFVAVLPAFFYVVFGATQDYADSSVGTGNIALYIMVSMAAYGAVTATVGIGGAAAIERLQGWGRQLALTPLRDRQFVTVKATVAVAVAVVPIALITVIGALTGARGTASTWLLSLGVVLGGACVFALGGLVIALAFRTEAAVGGAAGSLVILSFLGNVFVPLSGLILDIAKFTPLYGYIALARYPITRGVLINGNGDVVDRDPWWVPALNLGAWALILALLATWLVRRGRSRV